MKKTIAIFLFMLTIGSLILTSIPMSVNAHATADGVYNRLQQVYADIQKKFSNGVFSVNGKDCYTNSSHECSNCNLYSIVSNKLGEDLTAFKKKSSDGWQCAAFAKYVFVKTFGSCKETSDRYDIGSGQKAATYNSLKTGDLFFTSNHWMIYLSHNSSGVTVMDANGAGDLKIANKKTYSYSHSNLAGQVTVWHSNHWDKINTQYATKHTWGAWSTTTAATCTGTGTKTRTCSCGKKETQTIAALGHSYASAVTTSNATCTSTGTKAQSCVRCSQKGNVTTIPALGHSYSSSYTIDRAASCVSQGEKSRHCTRCSSRTDIAIISATGHSWGSWGTTKQATESSAGQESRKCQSCSATETRTIAKLATKGHKHDFSDWMLVNSATCIKTGKMHRSCFSCNQEELMEIAMTDHQYGEWTVAVEPTQASDGKAERYCKICNAVDTRTLTEENFSWVEESNSAYMESVNGIQENEPNATDIPDGAKVSTTDPVIIFVITATGVLIVGGIVLAVVEGVRKRNLISKKGK